MAKNNDNRLLVEGLACEGINIEEDGKIILYYSISNKNIYMAKLLIKLGVNINYTKRKAETGEIRITPLMQATAIGSFALCYLLRNKDIDINFTNNDGLNEVRLALIRGNYDMSFFHCLMALRSKKINYMRFFDIVF